MKGPPLNHFDSFNSFFFLFSKLAWSLLSPGNLIIIFLVFGVILLLFNKKTAAKTVLLPTAALSFALMIYPLGDYLIKPLESRFSKPTDLPNNIAGIIMLGGGEDLERSLSWHTAELGEAGDRYIGTADLASYYPNAKVIFTGGSGQVRLQDTQGEGSIAEKILTSVGIGSDRFIIESKSRNTYENFKNTLPLLPHIQNASISAPYLLVTSAYHMPRAVGVARQQQLEVIPYPVDFYSSREDLRQWGFNFDEHLKVLELAWREWIGLTVYYLTNKTDDWFPEETNK